MPAKYQPNPGLGAQIAKHLGGIAEQGGFVMERETKRRTPVDTGNLRNSFHTDVVREGPEIHVEVGSNVEYAAYVEHGTSRMGGHHMLGNAVIAAARWLAKRGFRITYTSTGGR